VGLEALGFTNKKEGRKVAGQDKRAYRGSSAWAQ